MKTMTEVREYEYVTHDNINYRVPYRGLKEFYVQSVINAGEQGFERGNRVYFNTFEEAYDFGAEYYYGFSVCHKTRGRITK